MTKIEALEKTIYNLENDVYEYKWRDINKCNCGILARTLLEGKTPSQCGFIDSIGGFGFSGAYNNAVEKCDTTGVPLPEVFSVLKSTGFTHQELYDLEMLNNKAISNRAGLEGRADFERKDNVIKYLRAWVEILKEQQPRKDITKDLAVLPVEERVDIFNKVETVNN